MANYKTGAQRYNDRMDKIFKKSEEAGHHTLHGSTERRKKGIAKKMSSADKLTGGHHGDYEKTRKAFLKSPLYIKNQFNKDK